MKLENTNLYPDYKKPPMTYGRVKKLVFLTLIFSFLVCLIVNLAVGGKPWCLYVLGSEVLFWVTFFSGGLIEFNIVQKFLHIVISVCLFLLLIDFLSGFAGWSILMAVPVVYFGAMVIASISFLAEFKRKRQNFLLLYLMFFASVVVLIISIAGVIEYRWPLIVLGSYSAAVIAVTLIWFRKAFLNELKKKWQS